MDEPGTRIDFAASSESDTDVDVGRAADGFALLGEPARLRILLALAGTRYGDWNHRGLAYTDLREAVDIEDGGRFNYHLSRLEGNFVRKEADRYRLTYAGSRLVNVAFAGTIDGRVGYRRKPIDAQWPTDEAPIEVGYEDGRFAIWRAEADEPLFDMTLPPAAAMERSRDELLALASTVARSYTRLAVDGMCLECWSTHDVAVAGADEPVRFSCDRCRTTFLLPAWYCIVYHPTIAAWLAEHGYDVDDLLSLFELNERESVRERGEDPISVTFTVDGESRTARFATDGTITVEWE